MQRWSKEENIQDYGWFWSSTGEQGRASSNQSSLGELYLYQNMAKETERALHSLAYPISESVFNRRATILSLQISQYSHLQCSVMSRVSALQCRHYRANGISTQTMERPRWVLQILKVAQLEKYKSLQWETEISISAKILHVQSERYLIFLRRK